MNNSLYKRLLPHLICLGIFIVLILIYFAPIFSGKILMQSDIIQTIGSLKEANDYREKTGEEILWSNSAFGGMPVWRGFGANVLIYVNTFLNAVIPTPVLLCLLAFIGFYILLLSLNVSAWLCFAGGVAFTFSSFNLVSIEAGHINKVFDMVLMAPVLGGIIYTYRGRYWLGAAITTLFLTLQIFYNHVQISYYLIIIILLLTVAEFYSSFKNKTLPHFFKASAILIGCAMIAVLPNISRLWTMAEYAKSTPRGGSELSSKKSDGGGLDKDYAFQWSYGVSETMTILIPSIYGGSSHEDVGTNSEIFDTMQKNGVGKREAKEYVKSMPLYWGTQPFTSGPVYFGAIIVFLFVMGLFLIEGPLKWWILGASILSIVLSWGKNFELVNDFFFYYVPMYNKFRSVTMILSIAQLTFPLLAIVTLSRILTAEFSKADILKTLKYSFIIVGGLTLVFALFGGAFFDFESPNDAQLKGQFPDWLMDALREDRVSFLKKDAFRSFVFIFLAAGGLWAFITDKLKAQYLAIAISFLLVFDLWGVGKRYLDNDDFKYKKNYEKEIFVPNSANLTIMQDPDPNFRVFNYTAGITSDALTSYFHKSLGGYSAIKLRRYQDVIDSAFSRGNQGVINMLNTKYFIGQDKASGSYIAQRNPEALGNAWFVKSFKLVGNADEEINSLKNINAKEVAYVNKNFQSQLQGLSETLDTAGQIKLLTYHPHRLNYKSNSSSEALAIFSEIYYQPGWNAYIDGKLTPHLQANYILRGLRVPAGEHKIEFKFEPEHYFIGEKISFVGSIIMVVFLVILFGREILVLLRKQKQKSI